MQRRNKRALSGVLPANPNLVTAKLVPGVFGFERVRLAINRGMSFTTQSRRQWPALHGVKRVVSKPAM